MLLRNTKYSNEIKLYYLYVTPLTNRIKLVVPNFESVNEIL